MLLEKSIGSCATTPIWLRSQHGSSSRTSRAVEQERPSRRIVEPRDQRRDRGLARAGRPDERDHLAGRIVHIETVEHGHVGRAG